jgi:adenosylcobinamide-GDP ribazoletransferase
VPDGLRLALTTLTVAPVRAPRLLDRRTAGQAMELAPLVGGLLALVAGSVLYGFRLLEDARSPDLLAPVVAVTVLTVLTRGLHLDGLADLVDGLGSYRDPAGARAVMKAPDVGPLGVAAVVLVLLLQVAALLSCVQHGRGTASLVLAVMAGRLAITGACRGIPAATPDGLGALVAATVRRGVVPLWGLAIATAAAAYAIVDPDAAGSRVDRVAHTVLALALALGAALLLRRHAVRRVGGITGDVLGALSEVATTVCLLVLATGSWGL